MIQPYGADLDTNHGDQLSTKGSLKYWKKIAKVMGRCVVALHAPCINPSTLADHKAQRNFERIIDTVKRSKESIKELDNKDNPALYWESYCFNIPGPVIVVWESIYNLPKVLGRFLLEEQLLDKVRLLCSGRILLNLT